MRIFYWSRLPLNKSCFDMWCCFISSFHLFRAYVWQSHCFDDRFANEPSIMKYIKIAASLRDKTVRDVALRCRWMTVSYWTCLAISFVVVVVIIIHFSKYSWLMADAFWRIVVYLLSDCFVRESAGNRKTIIWGKKWKTGRCDISCDLFFLSFYFVWYYEVTF